MCQSTYLPTYLKKLLSLILFIKRNGRLGQQKHYLEVVPLKSRWLYIKPHYASPKVTSLNARRNLEIYSSKLQHSPRILLKCSVLAKFTEISAVSIKMAHLVLTHQISQSQAGLHHCNRLSTEAGSQAPSPTWQQEWTTHKKLFASYVLQNI